MKLKRQAAKFMCPLRARLYCEASEFGSIQEAGELRKVSPTSSTADGCKHKLIR